MLKPKFLQSVIFLSLLSSCSPRTSTTDKVTCEANFLPGDLVITEYMANPAGDDEENEWIEIHNTGDTDTHLRGLEVIVSKADKTGDKTYVIDAGTIPAHGYLVLSSVIMEPYPDYVDIAYGKALSMRNSDGRMALRCGDIELDEVVYEKTYDGASTALSGNVTPDYQANNDPLAWCASKENIYTDTPREQYGTPGAANEYCMDLPTPDTEGQCNANGNMRDIIAPQLGDVIITEVMADPDLTTDANGEWFELYVAKAIDLNGLEFQTQADDIEESFTRIDCLTLPAGSYVVFAKSNDSNINGGIENVGDQLFKFSLRNSNGFLGVAYDGALLDSVTWATSSPGKSASLDREHLNPSENDDSAHWCVATANYGVGDLGTPGAENPSCETMPPPTSTCVENGVERPIVTLGEASLRITEIMANPNSVSDEKGEWFEVEALRTVDLNGLAIGTSTQSLRPPLASTDCVAYPAGTRILFARNVDTSVNGGLPAVDVAFDFGLVNSSGSLVLTYNDILLDHATWATSQAGKSNSRDDTSGAWCAASTTYGQGDFGTPRENNSACN